MRVYFLSFYGLLFRSQVKARQADTIGWGKKSHSSALVLAAASCWLSWLLLYHPEFLVLSKRHLVSGLGPTHLITPTLPPIKSGAFLFPFLILLQPYFLSSLYQVVLLYTETAGPNRIWRCCLELFMTYFGLSRQGRKYTVNLLDSKNRHLGPKRLTAYGNPGTPPFLHQPSVHRAGLCGLDGGADAPAVSPLAISCPYTVSQTPGTLLEASWPLEKVLELLKPLVVSLT